jgi:hypothetical protein
MLDGIHKILNQLWASHPVPVMRLQELKSWELSGYYQNILNGNYFKRGLYRENVNENIKGGYEYYRETMKNNDDTLSNIVNNVGEGIGKAADELNKTLKNIFKTNS